MSAEINLDPKDWDAARALAHQVVDDLMDFQQSLREHPAWQPIPEEVKKYFSQPMPQDPEGEEQAYRAFQEYILNYSMGNNHPRFWGWVMGNGFPLAALADYMASVLNPNMGGGDHVPVYVERQVIEWCKEMVSFPADSSGILVSGGSMANFAALAVARNARAGFDIRQKGLAAASQSMVFYCSTQTHSSVSKAIELLGIGKNWLRQIPVNERFQMDIQALEKAVEADKSAGYQPVCVVGTAATTNTGAFDDLAQLARICQREGMWFHVDGAFGALAAISAELKGLVAGMEQADSVAFDLHKLMYMPFEVACVLIRNFDDHIGTFSASPDYLAHMPRGVAGGKHAWFGDLGIQLTRGFRALKVWMGLKAYGMAHFRGQIEQNVAQARYLVEQIQAHSSLELLADAPFNIVCFRYVHPALEDAALNEINQEIMLRLHERGIAIPSYTKLNGKFAIRASITNHRTTREDLDLLVEKVIAFGSELVGERLVMANRAG